MAILGGVVAAATVQGIAGSGPADLGPPTGAGIMALNGKWVIDPGESFVVSSLGVLGATGNIDWSQAGYFSFTTTSGTNLTLTFGVTGSTTVLSATPGQMIKIRITGAGTPTITWPSTVAWVGIVSGGGTSSASAPVVVNTKQIDVTLVCTAGGSAPTFDGFFVAV